MALVRIVSAIMSVVLLSSMLGCLGQLSCPVPWWYCLNRDPKDSAQVRAVDTSNRSISWAWDTGTGRWDIAYVHSYISQYAIEACFSEYRDPRGACVGYSSSSSWSSNRRPIPATAWDISYNGDRFGFQPINPGQYVFHIYSRNLHCNPWVVNEGVGLPPRTEPPIVQDQQGSCSESSNDRTMGNGWWLERKSTLKCSILVKRRKMESPMEWSWASEAGTWKVYYAWNAEMVNCSVDFTASGASPSRLVSWSFVPDQLILSYSSLPIKIYREQAWKLMVSGGETWGFTPTLDGSLVFPVFSRRYLFKYSPSTRGRQSSWERVVDGFSLAGTYYSLLASTLISVRFFIVDAAISYLLLYLRREILPKTGSAVTDS